MYIGEVTYKKYKAFEKDEDGKLIPLKNKELVEEKTQYNTFALKAFEEMIHDGLSATRSDTEKVCIYDTDTKIFPCTARLDGFVEIGFNDVGIENPTATNDEMNNTVTLTWQNRFNPPSVTRTFNAIALANSGTDTIRCGVNLSSPCTQTDTEIVDIFYRIIIDYTNSLSNNDVIAGGIPDYSRLLIAADTQGSFGVQNESRNVAASAISLGIGNTVNVNNLGEGQVAPNLSSSSTLAGVETVLPLSKKGYSHSGIINYTTNIGINSYLGALISRILYTSRGSSYVGSSGKKIYSKKILSAGDDKTQSVFKKASTSTKPYLEASHIGASNVVFDVDSTSFPDNYPHMISIEFDASGDVGTSGYKFKKRICGGFEDGYDTETSISIIPYTRHTSLNSDLEWLHYRDGMVEKIDNKTIVTADDAGLTVFDLVTFTPIAFFDSTTTPAYTAGQVKYLKVDSSGNIWFNSESDGLFFINSAYNVITKISGIVGVDNDKCYSFDIKSNNDDIWAVFDGGLCQSTDGGTSWTVYNDTSPVKFDPSEIIADWSLGQNIAVDTSVDDKVLILRGASSNPYAWWWSRADAVTNGTSSHVNFTNATLGTNDKPNAFKYVEFLDMWTYRESSQSIYLLNYGSSSVPSFSISGYADIIDDVFIMPNSAGQDRIVNFQLSSSAISKIRFNNGTTVETDITSSLTDRSTSIGSINRIFHLQNGWCLIATDDSGGGLSLINPFVNTDKDGGTFDYIMWDEYGWNGASWEKDHAGYKTTHNASEEIFDSINVSFTNAGSAPEIVGTDNIVFFVYDGFISDNSSSMVYVTSVTYFDNEEVPETEFSSTTVPNSDIGLLTNKPFGFIPKIDNSITSLDENYIGSNKYAGFSDYTTGSFSNSVISDISMDGDFTFTFKPNGGKAGSIFDYQYLYIGDEDHTIRITDNGGSVRLMRNTITEFSSSFVNGDEFKVIRTGTSVSVEKNSVPIHTYTTALSGTAKIYYSARAPYSNISDMTMTYTENKRVVDIGIQVNNTGIYTDKYLNCNFITSDSYNISLDGTPANVLIDFDGTDIQPNAGEVLLRPYTGQLVFNSADAGKAITGKVTVMKI